MQLMKEKDELEQQIKGLNNDCDLLIQRNGLIEGIYYIFIEDRIY